MSSKREASPSTSTSASKRVKTSLSPVTDNAADPVEANIDPEIKSKPDGHTPSVTAISLDWLKFTPPAELQALLLSACAASPSTDALVAASLAKTAHLYEGDGLINDFKTEVGMVLGQAEFWHADEVWPQLLETFRNVAAEATRESPLQMKLSALQALVDMINGVVDTIAYNDRNAQWADGEAPSEMWLQVRRVLKRMTDDERRAHISEELAAELDTVIGESRTRDLYGVKGRGGRKKVADGRGGWYWSA